MLTAETRLVVSVSSHNTDDILGVVDAVASYQYNTAELVGPRKI